MPSEVSIFCAGFASATLLSVLLESYRKRREVEIPLSSSLSDEHLEKDILRPVMERREVEIPLSSSLSDEHFEKDILRPVMERREVEIPPSSSLSDEHLEKDILRPVEKEEIGDLGGKSKEEDTKSNLSENIEDESDTSETPFNYFAWRPLEYSVLFGVVGGLGPRAMTYFLEGLVTERCKLFHAMHKGRTPEERLELTLKVSSARWTLDEVRKVYGQTKGRSQLLDQDHIPLLAAQATTVPPRPKFILKQSDFDPLPQLISVSQGLVNGGATHLVVNCNTAHHFWARVKDYLPKVVFLDMVQITLEYAAQLAQNNLTPVGLFATTATIQTEMYQRVADSDFELRLVSPLDLPDGSLRQKCIENVIFGEKGIKSGYDNPDRQDEARMGLQALAFEALQLKRAFGTTIVILACSELPLILNEDSLDRWIEKVGLSEDDVREVSKIRFIDPGRVITHEMLRLALLSRQIRYFF